MIKRLKILLKLLDHYVPLKFNFNFHLTFGGKNLDNFCDANTTHATTSLAQICKYYNSLLVVLYIIFVTYSTVYVIFMLVTAYTGNIGVTIKCTRTIHIAS